MSEPRQTRAEREHKREDMAYRLWSVFVDHSDDGEPDSTWRALPAKERKQWRAVAQFVQRLANHEIATWLQITHEEDSSLDAAIMGAIKKHISKLNWRL